MILKHIKPFRWRRRFKRRESSRSVTALIV
jgi:hypothetical protein